MKYFTIFLILTLLVIIATARPVSMENRFLKLTFDPVGGRIVKAFYRPKNTEQTATTGLLRTGMWNAAPNFPFERRHEIRRDGQHRLILSGRGSGGVANFLTVEKTVLLPPEESVFTVDYHFENLPSSRTNLNFGFWFHNILGSPGKDVRYFYPLTWGVRVLKSAGRTGEVFMYQPSRGWLGGINQTNGSGVAITMDLKHLRCFYSWFTDMVVPTLEWRYELQSLAPGGSFNTHIEYIFFHGLKSISGAGNGLVGSIVPSRKKFPVGRNCNFTVSVYSAKKQRIKAEFFEGGVKRKTK